MGLQRVPLDGSLGGVRVFTVEGRDWSSQLLSVKESHFQWPILDNDDQQVVAAQKLTLVSAKNYVMSLEANKNVWTALGGTAPS